MIRIADTIEVKSNVYLTMRERGKITAKREGHNIWLNTGREYLAELISYLSFSPDTTERDDRVKYMGFGIGGTRQLALTAANTAPVVTAYPGTNLQTDTDPTVIQIERPVRVSGSTLTYPGQAGDAWIGQVQAPPVHPVATQTTFRRVFTQTEISYSSLVSIPLSEVALFTAAADPENFKNIAIAYDTFDTLSKTGAFDLEVVWTIKF